MENKKLMTLDEKISIHKKIQNFKSESSIKDYLKSIENIYFKNVYLDRGIINERYPLFIWNDITIGVDIILNDDLSIQSEEMEILYDYKDFINDNQTKQRNEDSDYTLINLDINLDQLIELHNKQLQCIVNICKDINGEEVLGLDEDLWNFIDTTMRTTFIKQTLKFI